MPDSFGARLRERREQQQVALTTIAEQTKIKVSLLEALERDDVSHWPSGIFRRAFIRAYAHAIGLEPDVIVREFIDLYPDPIEIVDTLHAGAPGSEGVWVSDGPPTRLRHLVASAIGSVSRLRVRGAQRPGPETEGLIAPAASTVSVAPTHAAAAATLDDEIPGLPARGLVGTGSLSATNEDLRITDPGPRMTDAGSLFPDPGNLTTSSYTVSGPIARETIHDEGRSTRPDSVASAVTEVVQPDDDPTLVMPPPTDGILEREPSHMGRPSEPDLMEVAELCTEFGRVETASDVQPLLQETARILDAVGLIVWAWDPIANELRAALAHGYSDRVLAQLPRVERDTNNATAAAFRAEQTCVVKSSGEVSGALAVPLMTPAGCAGVLAIELTHRREDRGSVRALATIFAAQLAALIGAARPAEATGRMFA